MYPFYAHLHVCHIFCVFSCGMAYAYSNKNKYSFQDDTKFKIHTEAETGFRAATACGNATTGTDTGNSNSWYSFKDETNSQIHTEAENN